MLWKGVLGNGSTQVGPTAQGLLIAASRGIGGNTKEALRSPCPRGCSSLRLQQGVAGDLFLGRLRSFLPRSRAGLRPSASVMVKAGLSLPPARLTQERSHWLTTALRPCL